MSFVVPPQFHVTGPVPPESLARIRGAMWTARAAIPFSHRPMQPDNTIALDYYECFDDGSKSVIKQAYIVDRQYTHGPMGPLVDPGYHGELPSTDWRTNPNPYLDAADDLQSSGCEPIHFLRPDRGVIGLEWTVDDLDRELGPVFSLARVQSSWRITCLGWEPGPKYYYDNAWFVGMCQWMARTFPNAIRLIHLVADQDSPVGGDDDKRGISNGQGWANVAPYIHGWLVQYGGYVGGQSADEFIPNLQASIADLKHRFATGGPDKTWPTSSAWGEGQPIKVYAGEYAAYRDYWENAPESDARRMGDAAMAVGADGYFDGGTVAVP